MKKKNILIILGILIVLVCVIGVSYAVWQVTLNQTDTNIVTTGCFKIEFSDVNPITIDKAYPMTDEEGKSLIPYEFTLTNTCDSEANYYINLETITNASKKLNEKYLRASLKKKDEEVFLNNLNSSYINLDKVIEESSNAYKLYQGVLTSKEEVTFSLNLWMDNETESLDEVMNATYEGKITLTATYVPKEGENDKELYNIIKKQASLDNTSSEFVTASTGIDFEKAPSDTNGKGVYTIADTKDFKYPVHCFRGAVENNNIKFASFCWKIVRTTETGGVKLIYNGTPNADGGCTTKTGTATQIGKSVFNSYGNLVEHVGYMYPESTNANNSIIKTAIDEWYSKNMDDYTSYLEDTVWCNDRNVSYVNQNGYIHYGAFTRTYTTHKPSIACTNDNDKFTVNSENGNGKLTYPVSLLTSDEVTLAGHGAAGYSSSSYLYTGEYWRLLTPRHFAESSANCFRVSSNGSLHDYNVRESHGVRPSISLAPGIVVTDSGDGTQNSPYEIVTQ